MSRPGSPDARRDAVLVLDADGRAGLSCVQSLGAAGARVHAAVRARGHLVERSRHAWRVHAQPPAEPVEPGVAWLRELDRGFGFTLVVPATESSLRWLRRLPEADPLRRKAVLAGDLALDAALDKEQTREIARRLGLPVPASRLLPQGAPPPPPVGLPSVLKPVRSKVVDRGRLLTLAAAVVRTAAEREARLAAWLPLTAVQEQAWVPGRGVGVELLYDRGRCAWSFVHERLHEWPLTGGASTLRRAAAPDPVLLGHSTRLLDAFGWHGAAMVEWRRAADGTAHLMEINPRLWGSLPLTVAAGVDVPRGLLALARGEPLPPAPRWRVGLTARALSDDLGWLRADARADHADPLLLTEPLLRAAAGWLRPLGGGEVYDAWRRDDPAVARGELLALLRRPAAAVRARLARRRALARERRAFLAAFGPDGRPPRPVARVLFLCLGNICRSPFAAAAARTRLRGVEIEGAGFHPRGGRPTPAHVVEAARDLGVDLSAASSRVVTAQALAQADLILAMELGQLERLAREHPAARRRATLLGFYAPPGPPEIPDPYALGPDPTRAALARILAALDGLAAVLERLRAP